MVACAVTPAVATAAASAAIFYALIANVAVTAGVSAAASVEQEGGSSEEAEAVPAEEDDETKKLMAQLTISMTGEVIDERTFEVRDVAKSGKKLMRLGNVAVPARGSLSEDDHQERSRVAKDTLTKLVGKQMIWWKAAPVQADSGDADVVLADVWSIDGKHVNGLLQKEGHLEASEEYESEIAGDILTAAAEESKKESYKKLEEALKEHERSKREAASKQRAEPQEPAEPAEPIGLGGWFGIGVIILLVVGVMTNFGRGAKPKKVNNNRKRGLFEKVWMKLKGA